MKNDMRVCYQLARVHVIMNTRTLFHFVEVHTELGVWKEVAMCEERRWAQTIADHLQAAGYGVTQP